jgi:hypothetical protein
VNYFLSDREVCYLFLELVVKVTWIVYILVMTFFRFVNFLSVFKYPLYWNLLLLYNYLNLIQTNPNPGS